MINNKNAFSVLLKIVYWHVMPKSGTAVKCIVVILFALFCIIVIIT